MKHKIEIWIYNNSSQMDIYIESLDNPEEYTIFDTCIVVEEIQAERIRDSYKYLGFEVEIKHLNTED